MEDLSGGPTFYHTHQTTCPHQWTVVKLATCEWCDVWLIVHICHDEGTCEVVVDPLVHGLHHQTQPTPTVGRHMQPFFVLLVKPKIVELWLKVCHSEGPSHTVFETSLDLAS